jgi:metal-responsive CopG/Arc/MetJ family transcriptional regulator
MDTNATTSETISCALPGNLIAQIDAQVGSSFVDREEFIRAAIRHYLDYLRSAQESQTVEIG